MLLKEIFSIIRGRWKFFAVFNLLFFSCVLVTVSAAEIMFWPPPLESETKLSVPTTFSDDWFTILSYIFFFNLAMNSFAFVTLPGIAFFPLSAGFLGFRAVLWGLLLHALPGWSFAALLPIIVLEGEAYVFAAVAGTVAGVSWLKPSWMFPADTAILFREDAFKKVLRESLRVYVFVAVLLFLAAVVETVEILWI